LDDRRIRYLASCLEEVREAHRDVGRRLDMLSHAIYRTERDDWIERMGKEALFVEQWAARQRLMEAEVGPEGRRRLRRSARGYSKWGDRMAATYRWITGQSPGESVVAEVEAFLAEAKS
jgi:hypothetical protein